MTLTQQCDNHNEERHTSCYHGHQSKYEINRHAACVRKWEIQSSSSENTKNRHHLADEDGSTVVPVHGMKVCWGADVWLHSFLTSALHGGELST
jgi:hypothetical protein